MALFLVVIILVGLQVGLALVRPTALIYVSLLTGAVVLTTLNAPGMFSSGRFEGALGNIDIGGIRILGFWLGACLVVLLHIERAWKYIVLWRFHCCFLLCCILSLIWAPSLEYGIRMLAKLSSPFLFLLLVTLVVSSKRQLKMMEGLILISALLMVVWAVGSRIAGVAPTYSELEGRLTTPGNSPAAFSAQLTAALVLALVRVRNGRAITYWALIIVYGASIFATVTRITIAALFGAVSSMLFFSSRGLARILIPLACLAAVPAVLLLNDTFRQRTFFKGQSATFESAMQNPSGGLQNFDSSGRFALWDYVMNEFFYPHPLFGSGIGATQTFFATNTRFGVIAVVHSDYVRLLAEVGLVGLVIFTIACGAYLVRLIQIYRSGPVSQAGNYALAGIGGMIAYMIVMATDNAFDYVLSFGIYVFGLIAMCEKARELERLELSQPQNYDQDPHERDGYNTNTSEAGNKKIRRYEIIGGGT